MEQGYYKSDLGNLYLIIENHEVTRTFFVDKIREKSSMPSPLMKKVVKHINKFFQVERREFSFPFVWKEQTFSSKSGSCSVIFYMLSPWPMSRQLRHTVIPKWWGQLPPQLPKSPYACCPLLPGDRRWWVIARLLWLHWDQTSTSWIRGFS